MSWFVYILECQDGAYYVGATTDVEKRLAAHGTAQGSRSVRMHGGPKRIAWHTEAGPSKSEGLKLEHLVKSLNRQERLALVAANHQGKSLTSFLYQAGLIDDCK